MDTYKSHTLGARRRDRSPIGILAGSCRDSRRCGHRGLTITRSARIPLPPGLRGQVQAAWHRQCRTSGPRRPIPREVDPLAVRIPQKCGYPESGSGCGSGSSGTAISGRRTVPASTVREGQDRPITGGEASGTTCRRPGRWTGRVRYPWRSRARPIGMSRRAGHENAAGTPHFFQRREPGNGPLGCPADPSHRSGQSPQRGQRRLVTEPVLYPAQAKSSENRLMVTLRA